MRFFSSARDRHIRRDFEITFEKAAAGTMTRGGRWRGGCRGKIIRTRNRATLMELKCTFISGLAILASNSQSCIQVSSLFLSPLCHFLFPPLNKPLQLTSSHNHLPSPHSYYRLNPIFLSNNPFQFIMLFPNFFFPSRIWINPF